MSKCTFVSNIPTSTCLIMISCMYPCASLDVMKGVIYHLSVVIPTVNGIFMLAEDMGLSYAVCDGVNI